MQHAASFCIAAGRCFLACLQQTRLCVARITTVHGQLLYVTLSSVTSLFFKSSDPIRSAQFALGSQFVHMHHQYVRILTL